MQVGFDSVRVFKKRNKALKKIHKLIKKGKLRATEVRYNLIIDNIHLFGSESFETGKFHLSVSFQPFALI